MFPWSIATDDQKYLGIYSHLPLNLLGLIAVSTRANANVIFDIPSYNTTRYKFSLIKIELLSFACTTLSQLVYVTNTALDHKQ